MHFSDCRFSTVNRLLRAMTIVQPDSSSYLYVLEKLLASCGASVTNILSKF
jgi:hypothetical protein